MKAEWREGLVHTAEKTKDQRSITRASESKPHLCRYIFILDSRTKTRVVTKSIRDNVNFSVFDLKEIRTVQMQTAA